MDLCISFKSKYLLCNSTIAYVGSYIGKLKSPLQRQAWKSHFSRIEHIKPAEFEFYNNYKIYSINFQINQDFFFFNITNSLKQNYLKIEIGLLDLM